jgi:hypothetical protein
LSATKRERARLARAELWMYLASVAEMHRKRLLDEDPHTLPVAQWAADDHEVQLCRLYGLRPADLAKLWNELGEALEQRAIRGGYDEHWEPTDPGGAA